MTNLTAKAEELLQGRLSAVTALETAVSNADAARETLRETETALARAWSDATAAGWTPAELKKIGIKQPSTRRGGRPRSTNKPATSTASVTELASRQQV